MDVNKDNIIPTTIVDAGDGTLKASNQPTDSHVFTIVKAGGDGPIRSHKRSRGAVLLDRVRLSDLVSMPTVP